MWYLHSHFVCDKLLAFCAISTFPFCILAWTTLVYYLERCFWYNHLSSTRIAGGLLCRMLCMRHWVTTHKHAAAAAAVAAAVSSQSPRIVQLLEEALPRISYAIVFSGGVQYIQNTDTKEALAKIEENGHCILERADSALEAVLQKLGISYSASSSTNNTRHYILDSTTVTPWDTLPDTRLYFIPTYQTINGKPIQILYSFFEKIGQKISQMTTYSSQKSLKRRNQQIDLHWRKAYVQILKKAARNLQKGLWTNYMEKRTTTEVQGVITIN